MFYCSSYQYCDISELKGKVITSISTDDYTYIRFNCDDGTSYMMHHVQDCCESVTIEEIIGDLDDLVGYTVLIAEMRYGDPTESEEENIWGDSATWTFYELATIKGSVTIRWYGTSNGYYSEEVTFERMNNGDS
jgi:hypothetical protein